MTIITVTNRLFILVKVSACRKNGRVCTEYAQGVKIAGLGSKYHQESILDEQMKIYIFTRLVQFRPEITVVHQLVLIRKEP